MACDISMAQDVMASEMRSREGERVRSACCSSAWGERKSANKMLRDIPVAFLVFDVLYAGGELLIDRPLRERAADFG